MDYSIILASLLSYLYGSIPFGYILGKLKDIDITKEYSGNIGTANVYRVLGLKYGILTFLLDTSKGIFALVLGIFLNINPLILEVMSLLGNIHSPFLRFKGGKGFANLAGFLLGYLIYTKNYLLLLMLVIKYLLVIILTGITSLANILTVVDLNLFAIVLDNYNIFYAIYILIILYSHRENIKRLLKRKERTTY